jgi:hypothetical protein
MTPQNYRYVGAEEIRAISSDRCPAIVLVSHYTHWMARTIRFFTLVDGHVTSDYSHAATLFEENKIGSQEARYTVVDWDRYLDGNHRVKVAMFTDLETWQRAKILSEVSRNVEGRPLYGIAGIPPHMARRVGRVGRQVAKVLPNPPWLRICSERVKSEFEKGFPMIGLPKNPSPADIDRWLRKRTWGVEILVFDPRVTGLEIAA